MRNVIDSLIDKSRKKRSCICVGLDPFLDKLPKELLLEAQLKLGNSLTAIAHAIIQFNHIVIDAVYDKVPVVKPQFACYLQFGVDGIFAFSETVKYAKQKGLIVISDAKSNDIGSSMECYINAFLGSITLDNSHFTAFNTDFLTINPYLGTDSYNEVKKVMNKNKGCFILVKTSNPSADELQNQIIQNMPLYQKVAADVSSYFGDTIGENGYLAAGVVVGATKAAELELLRKQFPLLYFLIPGYKTQGGTASDISKALGKNIGIIVNSSRGILYSYQEKKNAEKSLHESIISSVDEMNEDLNRFISY